MQVPELKPPPGCARPENPEQVSPTGWCGWRGVAAVVLLGLAVYWFTATGSTLWDRDEPRFARCAVEMVESGDYLVPTFNGELRPDKPAGIYWLMSVPLRLLGVSEWAVRAWSGIGVLIAAVAAAWLAWRHLGLRWPVLVAVSVLMTPLTFVVGTAATADGVLLACVTGAIVLYGQTLWNGWRWWTVLALGIVLGAALLVKGPVGLAVPLLTAVTAQIMLWRRHGQPLARPLARLAVASAIGLVVFAAWGLPANAATGGELARVGLGHHVLERMHTPLESHGGSFVLHLPYYVLVIVLLFVPWTLFLPAAVSAVLGGCVADARGRGLLVAWFLPTFLLMTLVATKLPHYILPVYPALAIAVALTVQAVHDRTLDERSLRWWRRGVWFAGPVGLLLAGLLMASPWLLPVPELRRLLVGVGLTVLVMTVAAVALHRRRRLRATLGILLLGSLAAMLQLRFTLPAIDSLKPAPEVAAIVRQEVGDDPSIPVAAVGFREPSLTFYMGRTFEELGATTAQGWIDTPGPGVLIASRQALEDLDSAPLVEIATVHGLNVAHGEWVDVVVLHRGR